MNNYIKLSLLVGLCVIVTTASSVIKTPRKLIIDTDAGGDDAGAIILALGAEKNISDFEVIAITCTYGNTYVKNVALNVLKTLTIANRSDIPVYIGGRKSLLRNYTSDDYYGEDGFGDFEFAEDLPDVIDQSLHASNALINLARLHAGNVSILALGPLTNIALAITLDPNFVDNVSRFYIMGASVHGIGNVAPNVEANFNHDPHSNFIVLNSTKELPAILLPWETALSAAIPMEWRTDVLGAIDSRIINFLNQAESKTLTGAIWKVADVITTALILWPELIIRTVVTNVTPVFDGTAQGSVLVDYDNSTGKPRNVEIIEDFDVERFKQLLLDAFK